jgi:transposase
VTTTMTFAGLDVHARSTHAAAIDARTGELRRARFGSDSEHVVAWLKRLPGPLRACYEAGPTGFALYRAAQEAGIALEVVAPSKTPRASGDRIKSDRKDAELLARLLLAGQLQAIAVPSPALEALRHAAVDGLVARKAALDERLSRLAREGECWPTVARLRCFRGLDTLSALVLCLEVGDFARFARPARLASWLGLVPALDQSGERRHQGAITKTGSGYARRLLVEAAWHYLRRPRIGATLANRQQGQPAHVLAIAWRAQLRLHRLYERLRARGKPGNVATVAVARELACFLWAAAVAP